MLVTAWFSPHKTKADEKVQLLVISIAHHTKNYSDVEFPEGNRNPAALVSLHRVDDFHASAQSKSRWQQTAVCLEHYFQGLQDFGEHNSHIFSDDYSFHTSLLFLALLIT